MKNSWKKVPPELSTFLEKALVSFACWKRTMFGCPVYFVNGNMFAGLHQDNVFIRLRADDQKRLFAQADEASVFEPMPGRPMKEYVVIPESLYSDSVKFLEWLDWSYRYVSALPKKEPKKTEKKK
jgi:TfoX/Sxy family transcriptional regulator of competence genes